MTREERNKFVEENMGLVHYWLRSFKDIPHYEDIYAYGIIGLIDALDRTKEKVNLGYLKKYVIGYATRYSQKYCSSMSKSLPYDGGYERVDCLSLDMQMVDGKEDSATYGEMLVDDSNPYDDIITVYDFENLLYEKKIKNPEAYLLLAQGYDRKDVAEELDISYERVRQQLSKLCRADFS